MADLVITITGAGKSAAYTPNAYLVVNNSMVISAQTATVSPGSTIECSAKKGSNGVARIVLDGTVVAESTASSTSAKYTLTANRNYTINLSVGTDAIITITSGIDPDDPMSPRDGHNTNVGQVAREILGGTVKINGVAGELKSGLVLVGGVAKEIEFVATVSITGSGSLTVLYITIDGTKHTSADTVVVPVGTIISCFAKHSYGNGYISLNGVTVASGTDASGNAASYEYEVTGNVTIKMTYSNYGGATIEITEE